MLQVFATFYNILLQAFLLFYMCLQCLTLLVGWQEGHPAYKG